MKIPRPRDMMDCALCRKDISKKEWSEQSHELGLRVDVEASELAICQRHTPIVVGASLIEYEEDGRLLIVQTDGPRSLVFEGSEIARSSISVEEGSVGTGTYVLLEPCEDGRKPTAYVLAYLNEPDGYGSHHRIWIGDSVIALARSAAASWTWPSDGTASTELYSRLHDTADRNHPYLHRVETGGVLLWFSHDTPVAYADGAVGYTVPSDWGPAIANQMANKNRQEVMYEVTQDEFAEKLGRLYTALSRGTNPKGEVYSLGRYETYTPPWYHASLSRMLRVLGEETDVECRSFGLARWDPSARKRGDLGPVASE